MRYSCHNKPRANGYWVRDMDYSGYPTIPPVNIWRWIPDRMSQGCAYDFSASDPLCEGCRNPEQKEAEAP